MFSLSFNELSLASIVLFSSIAACDSYTLVSLPVSNGSITSLLAVIALPTSLYENVLAGWTTKGGSQR